MHFGFRILTLMVVRAVTTGPFQQVYAFLSEAPQFAYTSHTSTTKLFSWQRGNDRFHATK